MRRLRQMIYLLTGNNPHNILHLSKTSQLTCMVNIERVKHTVLFRSCGEERFFSHYRIV